jgi:hypothetical protein
MYWFAYCCFLITSGSFVFLTVLASSSSNFKGPAGSLIGVVFTAQWAVKEWKSIKRAEFDGKSSTGTRAVELKCVLGALLVIAITGSYGYFAAQKVERSKRLNALLGQMQAVQSRNAVFKQRFMEAVSENTPTMDAYVSRCEHVEVALLEYEPALREADGQLAQLSEFVPEAKPQFEVIRRVFAVDLRSAQTFRHETQVAKQLRGMPPTQQRNFYQAYLIPIKQEEIQLGEEETQIVRDAQKAGVKLPEAFYQLGNK